MRLDLAEHLCCPSPHAPTPLVVVARTKRDRELMDGIAGCPVCRLEARVRDGHVRFAPTVSMPGGGHEGPARAAPPLDVDRVIALLGLAEPGGAVLLVGAYAAIAEELAARTGVGAIVMGAEPLPPASDAVAAVVGVTERVPFTDATFRGAAFGIGAPTSLLSDAVRTVAMGGRVLAAASLAVPAGLKELARDDLEWVAAREATVRVVELRRG